MSDLGKVLGSILACVAHARRIADEETVAIAEYYKSTDLLRGMSLPRIRIPQLEVDLPVLVESFDESREKTPRGRSEVKAEIRRILERLCADLKIRIPKKFLGRFTSELDRRLKVSDAPSREIALEAAEAAFLRARDSDPLEGRFTEAQAQAIRKALRKQVGETMDQEPAAAPCFDVSVVTGEVKERGGPANIARLKISLQEEGLEWTRIEQPDGTVTEILTPE